ncbi:hypothetical protein ACJX0J_039212, partial [Zea mays]
GDSFVRGDAIHVAKRLFKTLERKKEVEVGIGRIVGDYEDRTTYSVPDRPDKILKILLKPLSLQQHHHKTVQETEATFQPHTNANLWIILITGHNIQIIITEKVSKGKQVITKHKVIQQQAPFTGSK